MKTCFKKVLKSHSFVGSCFRTPVQGCSVVGKAEVDGNEMASLFYLKYLIIENKVRWLGRIQNYNKDYFFKVPWTCVGYFTLLWAAVLG